MGLYEFLITDKDGNVVATVDGARARGYSRYLNKAGDARFSISPRDPNITADMLLLGHKELSIYRAGSLVWGGELLYRRSDVGTNEEQMQLSAKGYLDLFSRRYIGTPTAPVNYTDTDLIEMARLAITSSQAVTNGDFGVTIGAHPTSRVGDRTNLIYKNLKDFLEELSNDRIQGGIDFEVTPSKQFNAYYPAKGRLIDSIVFEWGVNVDYFWEIQDATEMVNQVIVMGAGEGNAMVTATRNAATYLQETYRLRQAVLSEKWAIGTTTLEEHGDRKLADDQAQRQIFGLRIKGDNGPAFGSYDVGDVVRVEIDYGLIQIHGYYRIYGIDVQISDTDEETITLTFNPN